jgi:hypothetical protein
VTVSSGELAFGFCDGCGRVVAAGFAVLFACADTLLALQKEKMKMAAMIHFETRMSPNLSSQIDAGQR